MCGRFLRRLYDRYGPKRLVYANFAELLIVKELIPFFTSEDKEWILGRTAHTACTNSTGKSRALRR